MRPDRRAVIAGGAALGAAAIALPFVIDRGREEVSPAVARSRGATLQTLTSDEAATFEYLGEVLVPGAAEAGIAQFVDHHLSVRPAESLLLVRYLEVPPPYWDFYRGGIAAIDALARSHHRRPFTELDAGQSRELVEELLGGQPQGWRGPPAMLFFLAARSDAVDVVYGTMEGFKRLGVPYMAHIEPERSW